MTRWTPESDADRAQVRAQLERMCVHPLFRNSKRYPALLGYVVEQTLSGRAEQLKERNIGVAVFEREPDYDTNDDHIVRTTAGEIRKRLAQYYLDPAHASELRIELPSGSYVPWFYEPSKTNGTAASATPEPNGEAARGGALRHWMWAVGALAVLATAVVAWLMWGAGAAGNTALDNFWKPVVSARGTVLLCVGDTAVGVHDAPQETELDLTKASLFELHNLESAKVPFSDVVTLAKLSGYLGSRDARFRVLRERHAQLPDLHEGPAVLIGAADNSWTLRLARQQRFYFDYDGTKARLYIRDTQHTERRDWSVDFTQKASEFDEDYGLISRAFDPTTEQMVLVAAGITRYGTMAAGEFLTSESAMAKLAAMAPPGWEHKNIQIVFATRIVQGAPAPPRIVTAHFW